MGCLEAACSPDQTAYFFFYIAPDSDGVVQHYFAVTDEEHAANIAVATGQDYYGYEDYGYEDSGYEDYGYEGY